MKYHSQYRIYREVVPPNIRRFHWDIITMCNYNCDYCYSRANKAQWNKISNSKHIDNIIDKFENIVHPIDITLLGGEPTLHPSYYKIMDRLYNLYNLFSLNIISNGNYKDINKFINHHYKYKDKLKIYITFHPSQCKDIDVFKSNILEICQNLYLEINILLIEEHEVLIEDMISFCEHNNIFFRANQIFEDTQYRSTSLKFKNWMNNINQNHNIFKDMIFIDDDKNQTLMNDIDCYNNDVNSFYNWNCEQETYYIPVASDDIKQFCTEKLFTVEDLNKIDIIIKCPLQMCLCPGKVTPKKYK